MGSSPRVRGKLASSQPRHPPRTAHPRACGENPSSLPSNTILLGSSPRVRGKPRVFAHKRAVSGLIPARAGKTTGRAPREASRRAHPRACGENGVTATTETTGPGSSPRVRGKQTVTTDAGESIGLIPARAGKTTWRRAAKRSRTAHPRACGENRMASASIVSAVGSSPRVRGKHFLTWAFTAQAGQILETLEPSAFSGSYSFPGARANGGQRRAHRRGLCTGPALGRPLGAS